MNNRLPAIRSGKAAVIGALVVIIPYLFILSSQNILGPLPAIYASMATLYLLPTALCMVTAICGTVPMFAGLTTALSVSYLLMDSTGLLLTAAYVLPLITGYLAIVYFEIPFKKSCPAMIGLHVAALAAVVALCQAMTGNNLYEAAGAAAADFLGSWEMGDFMLYQFYSLGLIDLADSLRDTAVQPGLFGFSLSDAARQDMLLSVRALISGQLQLFIPNVIAGQSIQGGVGCMLLSLRFGYLAQEKREFVQTLPEEEAPAGPRAVQFSMLDMPPFQTWHLPRGIGWQVGAALAAGYVLRLSGAYALRVAGVMLYAAASTVFMIQGAAFINFMQKKRGTRRFWRVAAPLLLMMTPFLMLIGIFDQINNARGLRKPPEPKEGF